MYYSSSYRMDVVTLTKSYISTNGTIADAVAEMRRVLAREDTVSLRLVACRPDDSGTLKLARNEDGTPWGMEYEIAQYALNITAPWISR